MFNQEWQNLRLLPVIVVESANARQYRRTIAGFGHRLFPDCDLSIFCDDTHC